MIKVTGWILVAMWTAWVAVGAVMGLREIRKRRTAVPTQLVEPPQELEEVQKEVFAVLRLWLEIRKCLVFYPTYGGSMKLDVVASAQAWFHYRRTDPPYFREHWKEYCDLAYKYLYPLFGVFPEIMQTWAAEYEKIDKEPGSEEAKKRPYVLFEEAFWVGEWKEGEAEDDSTGTDREAEDSSS